MIGQELEGYMEIAAARIAIALGDLSLLRDSTRAIAI